jgi:hypothetical protein
MEKETRPERVGQVCKLINPCEDENPDDVYIIVEDPSVFSDDDNVYVVNLKELQKNLKNPVAASQIPVVKNELIVVAEDINSYIKNWNFLERTTSVPPVK